MMTDNEIMTELREKLGGGEFARELELLERMSQLRDNSAEGSNPDDAFLIAALDMWLVNNECSIEIGLDVKPEEVPLFLKVSKNSEQFDRYRKARQAAG